VKWVTALLLVACGHPASAPAPIHNVGDGDASVAAPARSLRAHVIKLDAQADYVLLTVDKGSDDGVGRNSKITLVGLPNVHAILVRVDKHTMIFRATLTMDHVAGQVIVEITLPPPDPAPPHGVIDI
jgi:hypothetical protein